MIQIRTQNGEWVRSIPTGRPETVEFHRSLGFVTAGTREDRIRLRSRAGLKTRSVTPEFAFGVVSDAKSFSLQNAQGCTIAPNGKNWNVVTKDGRFELSFIEATHQFTPVLVQVAKDEESKIWNALPLVACVLLIVLAIAVPGLFEKSEQVAEKPPEALPVVVQLENRTVVPIEKPKPPEKPQEQKNQALDKTAKMKKALTQNLGFLKLMGRKDLKKAMGGLPTNVPEASAGAGPGGKEGSGGELLVGLGKGLRRTTVGNTGLAGLGGIGTKGAGGGLGGYGETDYGSGAGQSISTIPLSKEAVIEGGLDRALIIATIMRYLSQVRACYEEGLKHRPNIIGSVTMNFEINGTGGVNFSRVSRSSLGDKEVEECISTRMMHWNFPAPKGGVNVGVSYPFMLRPGRG
ncbi:MAG: AgmX/PglI C-terminal domain-containing protein [Bdellovibrionia bacterium]